MQIVTNPKEDKLALCIKIKNEYTLLNSNSTSKILFYTGKITFINWSTFCNNLRLEITCMHTNSRVVKYLYIHRMEYYKKKVKCSFLCIDMKDLEDTLLSEKASLNSMQSFNWKVVL